MRLDPQAVPIELERLALSFNHMLERIEDVFTRQSNFSADIAHEIRTPITNLVTQTEIALSQSRSQQELEEVLYSNLEEFSAMSRMVSDMLFLAQADNNQLIPEQQALDLAEEVHKVFEFFEAWAEEKAVALRFVGSHCRVMGDPLMLRRAISNLLSNAIRYTPAGQAVTIQLSESAETIRLVVENPGTPIAAEHLPRLFDRFYRVDPLASAQRRGQRYRPGDCEIHRQRPPRQRSGAVRSALYAFYYRAAEIDAITAESQRAAPGGRPQYCRSLTLRSTSSPD
ncbi:sensor kinase CusS [Klebsiella variicola]|uniref:Sensor protein n=1 Tax=Klebsiella variicola TaxID=244366 RepID=A0A7H4MCK0_KLEVA|nr:sensor kinase CusS [Klebsiella variicola]